MERFITKKLLLWKNQVNRKPLIVRGARQVGKSFSINAFGKTHFEGQIHIVDFEKHPDWHNIFDKNLEIRRILSELEILLNSSITAGKDLLFFDEIQACPRAIMSLRYFYENDPELHVIAAGSLLEFATKDISFPVGRIQLLNMYPMNFAEFLIATGKSKAAEIIFAPPQKQPDTIHNMLLEEIHKYFFIGGMPECVRTFSETESLHHVFDIQASLVDSYRQDFSKYAPYSDKRCLSSVFSSTAVNVGHQIKYSRLAEGFTNPTIKKAFDLLCLAQVIQKIPSASPSGLPLNATASERKFKALMIDIGLMRYLNGLPTVVEFNKKDLLAIYQGAMAEQFVGQELTSVSQNLFYWSREAKSSNAEVDFLITKESKIYPVEVKSGPSGRLRSIHILLKTYPNCPLAYVLSGANFAQLPEQKLIFLPLYYAQSLVSNDLL